MADDERILLALQDTASTGVRVIGLRVVNYAIALLASVLIARALGPSGRGLYALPLAFLAIVMAFSHLGIQQASLFLASEGTSLRRLWAVGGVAAVGASVVAWMAVVGIRSVVGPSFLGGLPTSWLVIVLSQLPVILATLHWTGVLQLDGALRQLTLATFIGTLVYTAVVIGFAAADELTPFRALGLTWLTAVVPFVLLIRLGMSRGLAGSSIDRGLLRRAVAFGLRAQFASVFLFLLLRVDQLLVERALGFRALGLYALAVVIAEFLWLLTDPFATSMLPHQVASGTGEGRQLAYSTARMALIVAGGLCLVAWLVAPHAIRLVYGDSFVGATWALRWLLLGVVAIAVQRPLYAVVTKEGRLGLATCMNASALALNIVLNLILLKPLGIVGAAVASSIAYVLLGGGYVLATRVPGGPGWQDLIPRRADVVRLVDTLARRRRRGRTPGPPRLLLVTGTLGLGGTEGQLAFLTVELRRRGWDVTVVCLATAGPNAEVLSAEGIGIEVAGLKRFAWWRVLPSLGAMRAVTEIIRRHDPDVVHTFLYWGNLLGVAAARRAGVPAVVASLRSLRSASGALGTMRVWERATYRHADVCICNAEAVRAEAITYGLEASRAIVVPNGVRIPPQVSPPTGTGKVLCIANLIAYKSHDVLLEAFAEARGRLSSSRMATPVDGSGPTAVQPDATLLLAGGGPEERPLRELAERLGVSGGVSFLGSVPDVAPLLAECDFTVLASRSEGMPNAVLESLANGRAVVATSAGGTPEAVGPGGILVEPQDPAALAGALVDLWTHPGRARELGEAGRRHVMARFGVETMVQATESIYRSILSGKGRDVLVHQGGTS